MHIAHLDRLSGFLERLRRKERLLMVALGDSNTCNTNFTDGGKQWPELLHAKLKDLFATQTLLLVNAGVSGDSVEQALARFASDVARFRPELVIVCLGSNDANRLTDERFRAGMLQCLDQLDALGSAVLLRTPTPIMEYEPAPRHIWKGDFKLRDKVRLLREIAAERRLAFVDTYAIWCEAEAAGTLDMAPLMHDAVHTNAAGHRRVFEDLLPAFPAA
jgi:lysophospholipase L1-like esterase